MIDLLNNYDHELMLWLNYDGGTLLDAFWYVLSQIPTWIPFYIVILSTMISECRKGRQWKQVLILILFTALVIAAADQIASGILKPWIQRPRPSHQEGIMEYLHYVNDYHGGAYGFASSHAANSVALCVWVSLLYRKSWLTLSMVAFAALNCYSRIYLGVHYPGDLLCGTFIGICTASLGYHYYQRICMHYKMAATFADSPLPITIAFWGTLALIFSYALLQ